MNHLALLLTFLIAVMVYSQQGPEESLQQLHSINGQLPTIQNSSTQSTHNKPTSSKSQLEQLRKGLADRWTAHKQGPPRDRDKANIQAQLLAIRKALSKADKDGANSNRKSLRYNQFTESPREAALIGKENLNEADIRMIEQRQVPATTSTWSPLSIVVVLSMALLAIFWLVRLIRQVRGSGSPMIAPSEQAQTLASLS